MIRRYVGLVALALPLFVGCAAQTDEGAESTSSSESALGANGSTYVLTSFDGTSVLGLNNQGRTVTGSISGTTSFKLAVVDKFEPVDPCRTHAVAYNTYYGTNDTVGFNATLTAMVADSCKAKVLLSGSSIKTFQPAP